MRGASVLSEAGLLNKVRLGNLERYQHLPICLANGPAKLLLFPCLTVPLVADTNLHFSIHIETVKLKYT